ncbi:MAG: FtsW/RodA/SpoVE family cell cycle protein [Candidatus Harrisonbacteria bacterium]|nr:FtsW/RodA/SpoVE family cell cycle protein [Candidatus Harrisonbacteria bacterium]
MTSLLKSHDWILNAAMALLLASGLLMISSVSRELFLQQLISVFVGAVLLFAFSLINWRLLKSYPMIILAFYGFALLLLIAALFFAPEIRGTRGWLVIGSFRFQVAEFAKIALILLYAFFFSSRHIGISRLTNIVKSFVYFLIPAVLVFLQPDMGSLIVLLALWIGFLLVSGLPLRHILIGLIGLILIVMVAWSFVLADYQKERIIGFFQPDYDPLGINYSTIQAKIAIGSGGFWGKGYQRGTQTQLGFLPEAGTDFIYAAFIEEWGLFGGLAVLIFFMLLLWRVIRIGLYSAGNFYRLISLGVAVLFLTHFAINIGSATGLLPVIGIPFPFFSYGGSSLISSMMLIGILQSSRRFQHDDALARPVHSDIMAY